MPGGTAKQDAQKIRTDVPFSFLAVLPVSQVLPSQARCPVGSGASGAPATVVAAFARRPPFEAPVVVLDRSNENFGQNVQWPERVGVLFLGAV